ncbi:MAG: DUF1295 domain-containing protein [Proteobacteria bacterium]|nr:DUF1295 domain-containing protein [Pseudomonadota bacterium]
MTVVAAIALAAAVLVAIMAALWLRQRQTGNAGTVDIAWSFGTGLAGVWLALVPLAESSSNGTRQALVALMAALWAIRLGSHVWRRVISEEEDGRYRELRESWGADLQRRLFWFFQMQAVAAVLFALPMFIAARNPDPTLGWPDYLGLAIWLTALGGESIADRQLARFKAEAGRGGQVCERGLWRYSRHPNYFFEWLHWFAYVAIAFGGVGSYHWAWLTLAGPAFMLHILLRVTGVPPTERHLIASRGDSYRAYQKRTNVFFPGPQRPDDATNTARAP